MLTAGERELFEAVAFPLVASDARGLIEHINQAGENLFGWHAAEAIGRPLTVLMPERMRPRHEAGIARYVQTHESRLLGKPVRVPALLRDGTEVDIDLTLRLFRRPDGSDLIVASILPTDTSAPRPEGLVELETKLQRRAYRLI